MLDQVRPVSAWNDAVSMWLQGPDERPLTVVGFFTDWLFSAQVVLGLGALVAVVLVVRRRWLLAASAALVFPLVFLEVALKFLVDQPPASKFLQVRALFTSSNVHVEALAHGFPSGHAARIGFALGWLLLLLAPRRQRPVVAAGTLLLTLFIAWTRIYVGDHSLLEIVAGLLLAAAFLPLAGALLSLSRRQPAR
ncbi:MAG TPA: phosphatase PAP2 family protein [Chloroflexota bacterium]